MRYVDGELLRLHTPGHKGRMDSAALRTAAALDITEIAGADSLYEASGIIAKSEENCAFLFGAARTLYSAGGATLCIQTMLALGVGAGGTVIAGRNAHRAFLSTCALLDLDVHWLAPQTHSLLGGRVNAAAVEEAIARCPQASAVYLTSPDYLGDMCDIAAIARVCKAQGKRLLVDNAHGTHLRFCVPDLHPLTLGADLCADSAHKTLPVLTGGALLHIAPSAAVLAKEAKAAMALFGSTSPSYLTLASLDLCTSYLAGRGQAEIPAMQQSLTLLRKELAALGYDCPLCEPMRITIRPHEMGYTGTALASALRLQGVEVEFADAGHTVLLFSPANTQDELMQVRAALANIPRKQASKPAELGLPKLPKRAMRIKEALFAPQERLAVKDCAGRICAEVQASCPPGVPIVAPGEIIDAGSIKFLQMYSIETLNVVK